MVKEKRLRQTFNKVRILSLATPRARKELIRKGDRELIDCVSECCHNILHGKVILTSNQKNQLKRYKDKIREVAKKKTSLCKKREIIQKGGFLGIVLPAVAGFLGNLLFNR
jgi:triphosphoribosyl-dephospho-CoA synthetase